MYNFDDTMLSRICPMSLSGPRTKALRSEISTAYYLLCVIKYCRPLMQKKARKVENVLITK